MPHPIKHRSPLGAAFKEARTTSRRCCPPTSNQGGRAGDQAGRPCAAGDRTQGAQRRDWHGPNWTAWCRSTSSSPRGRPTRPRACSRRATPNSTLGASGRPRARHRCHRLRGRRLRRARATPATKCAAWCATAGAALERSAARCARATCCSREPAGRGRPESTSPTTWSTRWAAAEDDYKQQDREAAHGVRARWHARGNRARRLPRRARRQAALRSPAQPPRDRADAGRAGPPLTYLRAAMVVGAGSESYRTLRYLVSACPR